MLLIVISVDENPVKVLLIPIYSTFLAVVMSLRERISSGIRVV
jgi:hypothetical protein